MNRLIFALKGALEKADCLKADARLLCAVSGGGDSMALLHALCRLRRDVPFTLTAIHVQHGLRGEASLADERFVRQSCVALQVPCRVERARLEGDMHTPGMETMARSERRRLFEQAMQAEKAHAILFAHHQGDQAETVLMHLLRGAGAEGLRGMRAVTPFGTGTAIRPFLELPRQTLLEALEAEGLSWREDESNAEAVTARNALRLQVMPALETWFPGAERHIAAAAERLETDEVCLTAQADALYERALYARAPFFAIRRSEMRCAPDALCRRVLRRWWQEGIRRAGICVEERALSREETLCLCGLVQQDGCINLPGGLQACAEGGWICLLRQSGEAIEAVKPFRYELTAGAYETPLGRIECRPAGACVPHTPRRAVIPPDANAVLRTPQPGDRIHPLGAPGAKPLRRFLTDRKVPLLLRPVLPVLADGNEILWAPGLAVSEKLRLESVPEGSIELILQGDDALWPQ